MGATDDDYTTHSSQNYLMIALFTMYQATGEGSYLEEVNVLWSFLKERLLVDGQILHHWIDGRAAAEPDPYIYCLGCNVQTLYFLLVHANDIGALIKNGLERRFSLFSEPQGCLPWPLQPAPHTHARSLHRPLLLRRRGQSRKA